MIAKIVLLGLLLSPAFAAEAPAFQFSRAVVSPDSSQQSLVAVKLDTEVYSHGAVDFRDLRLVDQDAVETPFLLQKIASRKTLVQRDVQQGKIETLSKTADDSISVTVTLQPDAANADGLRLVTTQRDFEYSLQVQGSVDGNSWQNLVDDAAIYDYSRFAAISKREVELPGNQFRYFKIIVAKATQTRGAELLELTRSLQGNAEQQRSEKLQLRSEPLHIEAVEFWHNRSEAVADIAEQFEYPLTAYKVSEDSEHQTSLIDIESPAVPLSGFSLHSETANFSRDAEVQIPQQRGIENRWQTIVHDRLEALHFQDINREQTTLTFAEQRQSHYRIVIHNQDNPPLKIGSVSALGNGYQLLFLSQAGKSYWLQYGNGQAELPRYDTASIQELLRRGFQPTPAALGPATAATAVAEAFDFSALLNSKGFLVAAISLMVLVLGWSLYRAVKRLQDGTDRDGG
jgi:hypothetical protein